jgi:hypothetical protein
MKESNHLHKNLSIKAVKYEDINRAKEYAC